MPKTNEAAAVAAKAAAPKLRSKKVLTEKDIPIGNLPTARELKAQTEKELSAERAKDRPRAELARGIKSHDAPHASKAIGDAAAKARASNKADAVTQKAPSPKKAKVAARKAERQSWTEDRSYKAVVKLADITLRPGTWTEAMVQIALKHTTTAKANAELAKHREFGDRKIDWKWLATVRNYIAF